MASIESVTLDVAGSHRLTISSDTGPFTDPDGFAWDTVSP
jgi:hypothetical protein